MLLHVYTGYKSQVDNHKIRKIFRVVFGHGFSHHLMAVGDVQEITLRSNLFVVYLINLGK